MLCFSSPLSVDSEHNKQHKAAVHAMSSGSEAFPRLMAHRGSQNLCSAESGKMHYAFACMMNI